MTERIRSNFWEKFSLEEFNQAEWESLCDGCGKCCQIKLENSETTEVHYTKIACRLFDNKTCKCGNYALRKKLVSTCLILTPDSLEYSHQWMPNSCAYRLLYERKELPFWHHLRSGSFETVHQVGMSVKDATIPEYDIANDTWEDYIT